MKTKENTIFSASNKEGDVVPLITVAAGATCTAALDKASCLLATIDSLVSDLSEGPFQSSSSIFAIGYLAEIAKGLIDSVNSELYNRAAK